MVDWFCMRMFKWCTSLHPQHEQNTAAEMQLSTISSKPAKCSISGVKANVSNLMQSLAKLSNACCQCAKFCVSETTPTPAVKFNYWCKWSEKGRNTEQRLTLYVDNLYIIDRYCSGVSVIRSVSLCYDSMLDCSVITTMMHQLNWAELNYFSLNWGTNTKHYGNCKLWICHWSK